MVDLSISVEGVHGVGWPQWKRLVQTVEDLGFTGLYFSDHLVMVAPPDHHSLELVVALTYLADHTDRVRFGPMVSPLSFRDPVMLARQSAAIDELSGGRMVLGLGTGWMEREHTMFGYDLGDIPTRFKRFEEGLEVITRLLRSSEPVDFVGEFFQLRGAALPGPARPGGPEIQIGGKGPKRTLPLVARYADAWNAHVIGPAELRERNALLDTLLAAGAGSPRTSGGRSTSRSSAATPGRKSRRACPTCWISPRGAVSPSIRSWSGWRDSPPSWGRPPR